MCKHGLAWRGEKRPKSGMFVVTEADTAAIRAMFNEEGQLAAAIELRRRFLGITNNAKARECARIIAGWDVTQGRAVLCGAVAS